MSQEEEEILELEKFLETIPLDKLLGLFLAIEKNKELKKVQIQARAINKAEKHKLRAEKKRKKLPKQEYKTAKNKKKFEEKISNLNKEK